MEISIRSVDEACRVSGESFIPGNRVRSYLFRNEEGLIDRVDVLEGEMVNLVIEGTIICSWGHRIKEKETTEADEKRAALQSADEVFLSLYEENPEEADDFLDEARDRLKFFLALQLERKRILKPLGNRKFRHMPTKREFAVPDLEISPELIVQFQEEIALMSGGPA